MFCKNCGNQLKDGAAFCGKCGTKINVVGSAPNTGAVQPQSTPVQPQMTDVNQNKTGGSVVGIVIVILALLVVVGGVSAGLMYMMGVGPFESSYSSYDDDDDDDEDDDDDDRRDKKEENADEEESSDQAVADTEATVEDPIAATKKEFIIPDSSTRKLTEADLAGLSPQELSIARNEIYARHGYIFTKTVEWNDYFSQFDWYVQTSSDVTLNSIEQANAALILDYQKDNGLEWNFD